MENDLGTLVRSGELILRAKGGAVAARLRPPLALALMAANGKPPEGLVWGERFFCLSAEGQYVEGLLYSVHEIEVLPIERGES